MAIRAITCKTALSRSGIYGWEFALNPYRGCMHGCVYCYAPNITRQPRSGWGKSVEVKKNIPTVLAKELKRHKPALVGISSVTDPYQPVEETNRLTRYCLEQLLRYEFPVSIFTKSPLILRDLDLIKKFGHSELTISITTLDERLAAVLEPGAPAISQRLDALAKLSNEGLNTYAFLGPLLPALEYEQVLEFMDRIIGTGVRAVMVDTLNLKPGIWPGVERALANYPEIKSLFQMRLFKDKEYYPKMFELIKGECLRRGVNFE